jgi:hypothetical protein
MSLEAITQDNVSIRPHVWFWDAKHHHMPTKNNGTNGHIPKAMRVGPQPKAQTLLYNVHYTIERDLFELTEEGVKLLNKRDYQLGTNSRRNQRAKKERWSYKDRQAS